MALILFPISTPPSSPLPLSDLKNALQITGVGNNFGVYFPHIDGDTLAKILPRGNFLPISPPEWKRGRKL
ncbi:MAG: hypothetical protein C6I01_02445 [Epsilonproteobacteria bacterium]|nr:hypothetical protein [Campylobacterota bacterium]